MYIVFFDNEEIKALLMMYSVTCIAFCKCKNIKYSCQKDEPTFYSHEKNVQKNIKCSWFECPHCKVIPQYCTAHPVLCICCLNIISINWSNL